MSNATAVGVSRSFLKHARKVLRSGHPSRRDRHLADQIDDQLELLDQLLADERDEWTTEREDHETLFSMDDIPY